MANTIGAGILPLIFSFFIPHLFKWSQCMRVLPPLFSPAYMPPSVFPCFSVFFFSPLYQVQHNLVDSAFHKTWLDHFCPPWLSLLWLSLPAPESLPACSLAVHLYSSSTDYKILRARPWGFSLHAPPLPLALQRKDCWMKGWQERNGALTEPAAKLRTTLVWDKRMAVMRYMHDITV